MRRPNCRYNFGLTQMHFITHTHTHTPTVAHKHILLHLAGEISLSFIITRRCFKHSIKLLSGTFVIMTWLCKVSHVCCLQSNCENIFVIYAPHPLILKHNLLNRKQLVDAAEAQTFTLSIAKYVIRYGGFRLLAVTNKARIQLGRSKLPAFDITLFFGSLKS